MTTVEQLLARKGHDICSITPEATVLDAIKEFVSHNIGSLMVMEDDKLIGIFTERLYARNVFLKGKASPTTTVREVMKSEFTCVSLEHTVAQCMAIMTDNKNRHLPVLKDDKLVGVISIGDLVESTIEDQKTTIEHLERYIRS